MAKRYDDAGPLDDTEAMLWGISAGQAAAVSDRYTAIMDALRWAGSPRELDGFMVRRDAFRDFAGALNLRFVAHPDGWTLEDVP